MKDMHNVINALRVVPPIAVGTSGTGQMIGTRHPLQGIVATGTGEGVAGGVADQGVGIGGAGDILDVNQSIPLGIAAETGADTVGMAGGIGQRDLDGSLTVQVARRIAVGATVQGVGTTQPFQSVVTATT